MTAFDFDLFRLLCERACENLDMEDRLDDVLYIFQLFFSAYRQYSGEDHPPLSQARIEMYIPRMFYISSRYVDYELFKEEYPEIIAEYFRIPFQPGCNHRIFHFFSSDVIRIHILYRLGYL